MEKKITDECKSVNRRSVLKGAVGLGIMASAGGLGIHLTSHDAEAVLKPPKKWNSEADVVILGGGGAGMLAAIEARNAGSSVLLLEKMPIVGGSTGICGGLTSFAGSDEQKGMGINDSNKLFYDDFIKTGEGLCMGTLSNC